VPTLADNELFPVNSLAARHNAALAAQRPMRSIIADYIAKHRENAEKELRYFKLQRSLEDAVSLAALAKRPNGKRFSHQRRIPELVLRKVEKRLLAAVPTIRQAKSFDELHRIIENETLSIFGVGELMVYDTTLRIGAKLGLEPKEVFLHSGTRVGARKLGLNGSRRSLPVTEFPTLLRRLPAREIEDVLCIYKNVLGNSGRTYATFGRAIRCG
jgi:hypothetical protein